MFTCYKQTQKSKLLGLNSFNSFTVLETRETGHEKFYTGDVTIQDHV